MKFFGFILTSALLCAGSALAAPICPTTANNATGADATGCGVLLTYTASGPTVTVTGTGPYDGTEDTTVGVINNTSKALSSITLSSSMDAFGFEGDGIETFASTTVLLLEPAEPPAMKARIQRSIRRASSVATAR